MLRDEGGVRTRETEPPAHSRPCTSWHRCRAGYSVRSTSIGSERLARRAGIQQAEDEPAGDPELIFSHAYADPPASLARDLDEYFDEYFVECRP